MIDVVGTTDAATEVRTRVWTAGAPEFLAAFCPTHHLARSVEAIRRNARPQQCRPAPDYERLQLGPRHASSLESW